MRKIFFLLALLLVLTAGVGLYFFYPTSIAEKEKWELEGVTDVKIMSIKREGKTVTDAHVALYLQKIRYETLMLNALFSFSMPASSEIPQEIDCRIIYQDISIEQPLRSLKIPSEDSTRTISVLFLYNLSELRNKVPEEQIISFLRAFPSDNRIRYSIKPVYDSTHVETANEWIELSRKK